MDPERWRAEQRRIREAAAAERAPSTDGDGGVLLGAPAPSVSVILVGSSPPEMLVRSLRHVLGQDYPSYEILLIADGEEDDARKLVERTSDDELVRIFGAPLHAGRSYARNVGLRHARGEILAFIDADGFAHRSWLRNLVATFGWDPSIGGVSSTVFLASNPLVINGAGGVTNRRGRSAYLSMNQSYEQAEIVDEALYPMGCGMALRRAATEHVGPFDEHLVNSYDEVDYGIRLWRAGYRVLVNSRAWIDRGFFGYAGADSTDEGLFSERERIRVALKHTPPRRLAQWSRWEIASIGRGSRARRRLKVKAFVWNAVNSPSVLLSRWELRGRPAAPDRLIDSSSNDVFPTGVPPFASPLPTTARHLIDMADPASAGQLPYGWFSVERVAGRCYRWAARRAAALVSLERPVRWLRLRYAHVPVDGGGVDVEIRALGSPQPLRAVLSTHLGWQYIERCVENHPISLPAGDYEVIFSAPRGWAEPTPEHRSLTFALEYLSLDDSPEPLIGDVDMASQAVEEQLLSGWFEPEHGGGRRYRWAAEHAAVIVHLANDVSSVRLMYCLPPAPIGGLTMSARPLNSRPAVWSTRIIWHDGDWHEDSFPLRLTAGDYVVAFDADATWSNPGQKDLAHPPENRSLSFALCSLLFEAASRG